MIFIIEVDQPNLPNGQDSYNNKDSSECLYDITLKLLVRRHRIEPHQVSIEFQSYISDILRNPAVFYTASNIDINTFYHINIKRNLIISIWNYLNKILKKKVKGLIFGQVFSSSFFLLRVLGKLVENPNFRKIFHNILNHEINKIIFSETPNTSPRNP